MRIMKIMVAGLYLCLAALLPAAAQTTVESFSPTGTVKKIRQVAARFSADMIPFGDIRLADPFTVDCPEQGKGRWIDTRNWVYDFARDLPGGVACRFTLRPGQADLAGKPLVGDVQFSLDTGGPSIVRSMPREGYVIDENQMFVLSLDAAVREDSIQPNAWCRAEGINERIAVRVLHGQERDKVLAQRKAFVKEHQRRQPEKGGDAAIVVLQCARTLPAGADVTLGWGKGIATPGGVATATDQKLWFDTRKDFVASFSCQRTAPKAGCIPFLPIQLSFSAPIPVKEANEITLTSASGDVFRAAVEASKSGYVDDVTFKGPFPENTRFTLALPPGLKDDAGRTLLNRGSLAAGVATDRAPPLVKFPARFGILEARGDRLLPVTVRNVERGLKAKIVDATVHSPAPVKGAILRVADNEDGQVIKWLAAMSGGRGWDLPELEGKALYRSMLGAAGGAEQFSLPRARGRQPFEVIGIPLKQPGFYVVELASPRLGTVLKDKKATAYVSTAALVTNLAAHFKHGAESSLVWVTTLDKGRPAPGAKVAVRDCAGKELWSGATDRNGVARIGKEIRSRCKQGERYFISARLGGDMTFTLSDWNRGIEVWRFNVPTEWHGADSVIAATVFDRTLLRAGETVHMKHFLRRHTRAGLATVGKGDAQRPAKAYITHVGTDEKFELPLSWSANATSAGDWKIPEGAKLGTYEVMLGGRVSGSFRVEQFRIPLMKGSVQGPAMPAVAPASLPLDLQLNYLSGGGAAYAPVKLRSTVGPRHVSFDDYDGFRFAAGDIKEGIASAYGGDDDEDEGAEAEGGAAETRSLRTQEVSLDKGGGARVVLDKMPAVATPQDLHAEMSYQDPNGETQTVSTTVPLWPSAVVVGIKPDGWMQSKDALRLQALVLDVAGKPVAGAPVSVDLFQSEVYSHRRRLLGGFYAYESQREVKRLGQACEGVTDQRGMLFCEAKSPAEGSLIVRARSADAQQRAAVTHTDVWVAGSKDSWFDVSDNDRIDMLPSQKRFEPGETATFQVRSPFREATALVTVEREGVIDTYIRRLKGDNRSFSIPVKGSYAPNVFVSALVVRGRVAGVQPSALVDLGKPAYKLGIAPIKVGWAAHELKVQVGTDRQVYKVREKAQVTVKVSRADGKVLPAGAEVALAAVDAGLLELMPNASWDLLETMMQQRGLQVTTATAQMQVIGKRHFGRKAVAAGGGGGRSSGRELFDTLLFWKATVKLDAKGEASVTVALNDSLTAFRIVAVASAGAGQFGTGRTEIRSTQDLMLLSGLPQLARQGDSFRAGYTLRNASDRTLTSELRVSVAADGARAVALPAQTVTLAAGESREVGWDYTVPAGARKLAWEASARADGAADTVRSQQEVKSAVPERTVQATLAQLDQPLAIPVRMPADALAGQGGIVAKLAARLAENMPGVSEYMQAYPYTCFEQVTSRAVALRDRALWERHVKALPAHLDGDGLVKYFTLMDKGSDALTAYVLSVTGEAGYAVPDELRERMREGLSGFVRGTVTRGSPLATADLAVRKVAALEALSREAPLSADLLGSFSVTPNLWPTGAVIDWYLAMKRNPQLAGSAAWMLDAERVLRARLHLQGTTMGFSTEQQDGWWWLMMSADTNANRLLLAMMDNPKWQPDMGRMARGALGRQHKGRWSTTVANAWGVLAMDKFSATFESQPVTGTTTGELAGDERSAAWPAQEANAGLELAFPWPAGMQDLAIAHKGSGKPWVTVQSLAAIPLKEPLFAGFRMTKTITPVDRKDANAWSRGDVYRVRLDLEAQSDMTWVVVDDPIPASATVLGSGLGRDSRIQSAGEVQEGWVWPAFQERSNEAFRSYYEFVPKGKWRVEYTVRLNNAGRFSLPPTRAEAMYNPGMFGELPNAALAVKP
ncbi:alpha-2-macroglobulin family protein [Massilia cavernae]|uniref:Alpha-2-macroglobulin n=1 Tax=Massilia cavernae TaxID=2320864 RepID=A0A418Y775_9BURK|nr:MG2 domain-containing protein [Massilia cavernae]RJG25100.1 alpha-2-macroglobulin [Massilia cavernae]